MPVFVVLIRSNRSLLTNWMDFAANNSILTAVLCWANPKIEWYLLITTVANVLVCEVRIRLTLESLKSTAEYRSTGACTYTRWMLVDSMAVCVAVHTMLCIRITAISIAQVLSFVFFCSVVVLKCWIRMICRFEWITRACNSHGQRKGSSCVFYSLW